MRRMPRRHVVAHRSSVTSFVKQTTRCPTVAARRRTWVSGNLSLRHDEMGQHVGEHQHVFVALVVRTDVGHPITLQAGDDFSGCQIEVSLQHGFQLSAAPVRVGAAEERGDVATVCAPLRLRRGERSLIAGLGRADHAGGLHNVRGFIASASPL